MREEQLLCILKQMQNVCKSINEKTKTANPSSKLVYEVLQLSDLAKNAQNNPRKLIKAIADFYNLNWKGNADFMHIPNYEQVMDNISKKHGYHSDVLYSIFFKGQTGAETMRTIMSNLHQHPLKEVAGLKVIAVEDYLYLTRTSGEDEEYIENLPSTNAVKYFLEDGSTIAISPSGTEPKSKFNYGAISKNSFEEANKMPEKLHASFMELLNIEE